MGELTITQINSKINHSLLPTHLQYTVLDKRNNPECLVIVQFFIILPPFNFGRRFGVGHTGDVSGLSGPAVELGFLFGEAGCNWKKSEKEIIINYIE